MYKPDINYKEQPLGNQDFIFKVKLERLLTFLISPGIISQIFGAKYLNDRKP